MSGEAAALRDVTVVDLTGDVGGAYAGKLLADLGAHVVMVEPPGGSSLRLRPPLLPDGTGALFAHLSGGKASIVVRPDEPADGPAGGGATLRELLAGADILLTDQTTPGPPLVPAVLPPHLVAVDLTPFGRSGPYAGWRGSDLAVWAMGGYLQLTGAPDREPLWVPGSQAQLQAGAQAAFAALVGLYEQRRSGWGQVVEVTALEATLSAHAWLVSSWAACGVALTRQPSDLVRAADDWVYFMQIVPNDDLFVLIERPDLYDEHLASDLLTWYANISRIFEAVASWAANHPVDEIVETAQALRLAVTPVLDSAGVDDDEQLAVRQWWETDDAGPAGGVRFPGQPFHLSATPSHRRGPAPEPGSGDRRVEPPPRPTPLGAPPSGPPLQGLRVVEVTNNWAGPLCGRFLADLGADVVKIERPSRPATRALFWPGPGGQDRQRQGLHRAMYFNELNRNKRDLALDLAEPAGREAFLDLIAGVDVVIENNSARVMPNLGLDWEVVHARNPRLVMVSMSGYGAEGPRRDWVAYGSNIETTSGLTSTTGYPDGQLSRTTLYYADPVSGIHGAVAVMAALEHVRRTGEGQWIEMSLNECGAAFCCEALLRHSVEAVTDSDAVQGAAGPPDANRDPRFAPHGVYACIGSDHWVAIAVQSDAEWPQLAALVGRADLAADPELATLAGRRARQDELDAAIAAWTSGLEQYEVAWAVQRAGISAAPVLANWQVLPDPHIHHRGFYQPLEHPVVGVYPTTTWPWRFARTPARLARPAPLFGEHNRQVLREAGFDEARLEALYAAGVTADEPLV